MSKHAIAVHLNPSQLLGWVQHLIARRVARVALHGMSDAALRDIGLSRGEISRIHGDR